MIIVHKINGFEKAGEGTASFLLTNKKGSFFSITGKQNLTKFQGLFVLDENDLYKTIENLYLEKNVEGIENHFSGIRRYSGNSEEVFYLTPNALIYDVNNYSGTLTIELDFRPIYDFDDRGRIYKVYREGDLVMVEYTKFKDSNLNEINHTRYLVIKGLKQFDVSGRWLRKEYEYDRARNDSHEFYVYEAIKARIEQKARIIFSVSKSKQEAIEKVTYVDDNRDSIIHSLQHYSEKTLKIPNVAYNAAAKSLDDLTVFVNKQRNITGIWAGLPWFHQFWARDELICLRALILQEKYGLVKDILMRYLNLIQTDGRLPNRDPPAKLGNADAIGWLFRRFYDLIHELRRRKILDDYFSIKELKIILQKLTDSIESIEEIYTMEGMITNHAKETWMDTDYGNDSREGVRIEIQALHLAMYHFAHYLCGLLDIKDVKYFTQREAFLRSKVREVFFNSEILADGFHYGIDRTVRPNIFLAYYVYPELLNDREWKTVFKTALDRLWLEWGGLSSIDKAHPLFCAHHTGTTNQSYHRGDSWFFINNLAALCMHRLDKKAFNDYIHKIKDASEKEILFSGFIGHASELSSASELRSEGALAQAWSAATFIEMMHELG